MNKSTITGVLGLLGGFLLGILVAHQDAPEDVASEAEIHTEGERVASPSSATNRRPETEHVAAPSQDHELEDTLREAATQHLAQTAQATGPARTAVTPGECPPMNAELQAAFDLLELDQEELLEIAANVETHQSEEGPTLRDLTVEASLSAAEQRELRTIVRDLRSEIEDRVGLWDEPFEAEAEFEPPTADGLVDDIDQQIGVYQAMRDAQVRLNELLGPERAAELEPELANIFFLADNEPDDRAI